MKKVLVVLMIALLCISFVNANVCFAKWQPNLEQFDGQNDSELDSKAQKIVGAIISVVRIVAVGVAIIMLAFVAMKYMSAAPGDRAEIKKHAVIYVVGAVVLFGGAQLIGIIQNFAKNIN